MSLNSGHIILLADVTENLLEILRYTLPFTHNKEKEMTEMQM